MNERFTLRGLIYLLGLLFLVVTGIFAFAGFNPIHPYNPEQIVESAGGQAGSLKHAIWLTPGGK